MHDVFFHIKQIASIATRGQALGWCPLRHRAALHLRIVEAQSKGMEPIAFRLEAIRIKLGCRYHLVCCGLVLEESKANSSCQLQEEEDAAGGGDQNKQADWRKRNQKALVPTCFNLARDQLTCQPWIGNASSFPARDVRLSARSHKVTPRSLAPQRGHKAEVNRRQWSTRQGW